MAAKRTKRTCATEAVADAASFGSCSDPFVASRPRSPMRPLTTGTLDPIQTALSPHFSRGRKTRKSMLLIELQGTAAFDAGHQSSPVAGELPCAASEFSSHAFALPSRSRRRSSRRMRDDQCFYVFVMAATMSAMSTSDSGLWMCHVRRWLSGPCTVRTVSKGGQPGSWQASSATVTRSSSPRASCSETQAFTSLARPGAVRRAKRFFMTRHHPDASRGLGHLRHRQRARPGV